MNHCFNLRCTVALALGLMLIFGPGRQALAQQESTKNLWSRWLHVIVMTPGEVGSRSSQTQFDVVSLPTADLPEKLSTALFPSSGCTMEVQGDLGIPANVTLLDIFTFKLPEKAIKQSKAMTRKNDLADLGYSVKVRNWSDDSCEIDLTGRYQRSLPSVAFHASRKTTTLVHVNSSPRILFAFTFLDATSLVHSAKEPDHVKGISKPKIIANPRPKYPEELRAARKEGLFSFVAIITREGKIDSSRWVVLECLHPFFARNALGTIIESWELVPGKMGTQAVDILAVIEVNFILYAPMNGSVRNRRN